MSPLAALPWVFVGGGAGAAARHLVARTVSIWGPASSWPLGTLVVNLSGSLLLGAVTGLVGHGLAAPAEVLLATGVAGGFTTFSSLSYETVRLAEEGLALEALLNPAVSLVGGFALFAAGLALTGGRVL